MPSTTGRVVGVAAGSVITAGIGVLGKGKFVRTWLIASGIGVGLIVLGTVLKK